jgi:hypothetical protein
MAKKAKEIQIPVPVIIDRSIKDHIDESYIEFGNYVNQKRHMPHLIDGLKPSYRKMIFTGTTFPDKMVKVATLSGECGGKYSPHSPDSLNDVVSELVHAGIFQGQGSHGVKSIYKEWNINAAAPRYIEAKMDPTWSKIIDTVLPYVPRVTSDLGYSEPTYIPTPIPLSLLYGSLGLGIGIRSKIPTFSFKSILEAYKADDPNLLESNGNLAINKRKSELHSLWTTGKGKVSYMFYIDENATSIDGVTKGYMMYGDPRFFQVSLTKNLDGDKEKDILGWIDKGLVIMNDESERVKGKTTRAGNKKIFFTVKPKQTTVTMKMLRDELEIMRYSNDTFKLALSNGENTKVTPLRDWIGFCFKNYESLVNEHKKNKVKVFDMKEKVIAVSDDVVDYIRKNPKADSAEIAKDLKLDEELVKEVTKKSISVLMKVDKDKELAAIANQRIELNKLKASDFYEPLMK